MCRLRRNPRSARSPGASVKAESPDLPPVEIVDQTPIGDAVKALGESPVAPPAGDLSSGGADTPAQNNSESDPAHSSAEKRGRGRPPGSGGKFKKAERPRGDATLTAHELEKMRKDGVAALLLQAQRDNKALEEKLADANVRAAVGDIQKSSVIDDSITEACGFAAETLGNMAAAKWGPAARINPKQKEELARAWSRVAKLYLGEHAQYSPLAAALLATVAVAGEKYVDVQLAASGSPRPALVSQG